MNTSPNPKKCPICGNVNDCEIAEGADSCWCFSYDFSEELRDRVPKALRGKACICKHCAEAEREKTFLKNDAIPEE